MHDQRPTGAENVLDTQRVLAELRPQIEMGES
jgi:hypothetical protein